MSARMTTKSGRNQTAMLVRQFNSQTDNQHITRQRLVVSGGLATAATTIINTTIPMSPTGTSEWASFIALYDEFRVLGVRLTMVPLQQGSVTTLNGSIVVVFDNDDTTALTSYNAGLEYDTARPFSLIWYQNQGKLFQQAWSRPTAGANTPVIWTDVAAPTTQPGSIKFYSSGGTASTSYINYNLEYFIEFRGRR